jgi:hypothetical protein
VWLETIPELRFEGSPPAPMGEAERVLEVTRRIHALAASPEGQTLTLVELEPVVAKKESAEVFEDSGADAKVARASRKRRCGPR